MTEFACRRESRRAARAPEHGPPLPSMGTRAPIWRHRWRACLVAVVASLIAVPQTASAEIGNSDYLSGTLRPGLAQVLSPRPGGIVKGDSARIRVRLAPGTHSFKAWLGPTDITRLFHREGDARVAELSTRRFRALKLGPNNLYVRVRDRRGHRDFDAVRFLRAQRTRSLLRLAPNPQATISRPRGHLSPAAHGKRDRPRNQVRRGGRTALDGRDHPAGRTEDPAGGRPHRHRGRPDRTGRAARRTAQPALHRTRPQPAGAARRARPDRPQPGRERLVRRR